MKNPNDESLKIKLIFSMLIAQCMRHTAAAILPTKNIAAHYALDGNTLDSSAAGNHAAIVGQLTLATDRFGRADSCYYFNGNTHIQADCSQFPVTNWTISFWSNAEILTTTKGQGIIPCALGGVWENAKGAACDSTIAFILNNMDSPGRKNTFELQVGCNANRIAQINAPSSVGKWQHWAATTSNTGTKLYLNGTLVAENSHSIHKTDLLNKLFSIGAAVSSDRVTNYADRNVAPWQGLLDDFLIHKVPLAQEEIKELFLNKPPALANNTFSITDNTPLTLTSEMLSATDISLDQQNNLIFIMSNIENGQFEFQSFPGIAITHFTQQQLQDGAVKFIPNNPQQTPTFKIKVSDGLLWTDPTAANIAFHTLSPTGQPSNIPSGQPSSEPSGQPSQNPSSNPTRTPIGSPTNTPSQSPSAQPTRNPSLRPSTRQSFRPSQDSTQLPTRFPTNMPTRESHYQPTTQPTFPPLNNYLIIIIALVGVIVAGLSIFFCYFRNTRQDAVLPIAPIKQDHHQQQKLEQSHQAPQEQHLELERYDSEPKQHYPEVSANSTIVINNNFYSTYPLRENSASMFYHAQPLNSVTAIPIPNSNKNY